MVSYDNYINFIKKHFDGEYDIDKCNNEYINNELNIKLNNIDDEDCYIEIIIGPKLKLIFDVDELGNIMENQTELLYKTDDIEIAHNNNNNDKNYIFIKYKKIYKINLLFVDDENIELADNIIENCEYRNNGIGTEGINYLLNFLRKAKYKKLHGTISTVDDVVKLNRFYKKNRFDINGDKIQYIF